MRRHSRAAPVLCLTMLTFGAGAFGADPPLDVKNVQQVREACVIGCPEDEKRALVYVYLLSTGEKAFPAYEAILSDPKATDVEVVSVFRTLSEVKANPRRFLKYALSRLTDGKVSVRHSAVNLLQRIGSPAEASPVLALLSDKDATTIPYAAARTLAVIGGPNEIVAMDVWLRGDSHRNDEHLRKYVQKCRDELKKRLAEKKDLTK